MTLHDLLQIGMEQHTAISAPGRQDLSHGALRVHVEETVRRLNRCGIGQGDRIAIVLPNGPEMATAFIALSCGATTAPLNPGYQKAEFDFYLDDLKAKALLVEAGSDSAAIESARERGVHVLYLAADPSVAGRFSLEMPDEIADAMEDAAPQYAQADDIALVLHTSGTTSRPKIVPLTHRNICASAANIRTTLKLTPEDRCMNVMPLFHIHGLMAAIVASLAAGASVFCTPGFNALRFFGWLEQAAPTWYTAVPTMHQAVLARATHNAQIIEKSALRFVRSSSSSLPPQVMRSLEETFDAPVIEAYAMTEAAHQMTSNPLPPLARKAGTVGLAAGPEVAIMNEKGSLLSAGELGEVVIRGENVTPGYENNAQANRESFTEGWFRTGDQGVMDADGYLTITGRLKEIINRGGEKISPREVDDVLMDHPAVAQVVTFALPHDKLGEEVAAAVVLAEGESASEKDIRSFASGRLAQFKVPRTIVFVDEIPKGATGKLQRIGLAKKLGLA
jgi:acyl-CoA synthetase (AMP-forming)/AMP-acid ligase II